MAAGGGIGCDKIRFVRAFITGEVGRRLAASLATAAGAKIVDYCHEASPLRNFSMPYAAAVRCHMPCATVNRNNGAYSYAMLLRYRLMRRLIRDDEQSPTAAFTLDAITIHAAIFTTSWNTTALRLRWLSIDAALY